MDIFSSSPGMATAIDGPGIPMNLFIADWEGFSGFKSIVTGFQVQMQNGVQFMHTLRDFIYIYTFGERIGMITISGVSMMLSCFNSDNCHGLEYIAQYYIDNRVSSRAEPVELVLGCFAAYFGFLVECTVNLNDPANNLGQFNLVFRGLADIEVEEAPEDLPNALVGHTGELPAEGTVPGSNAPPTENLA